MPEGASVSMRRRWRLRAAVGIGAALLALPLGVASGYAGGAGTAAPAVTAGDGPDGVAEIYPTKQGGEEWFLGDDPENDPRFDPQDDISRNSDGSWKMKSDKVRMGVRTSTYRWGDEDHVTWDQGELESRGHMYDRNDWRDVEMTGYVKLNDGDGDDFDWYARGVRHTGDGDPPEACWGTAYKSRMEYDDGDTGWGKEVWHSHGYADDQMKGEKNVVNRSLKGHWTGFKAVMYNVTGGVHLEIYVDRDNDNQWVKAAEYTDTGGWATDSNDCGGSDDQIISWGGPVADFRWDNASDVDFTKLSVREIDPSGSTTPTPPPTDPGSCPAIAPASVTATDDDGHGPRNAVDGDPDTRWSAQDPPQSITLDMGTTGDVCAVGISWYQGGSRRNTFTIGTSTDGSSFSRAYSATSSGSSDAEERYDLSARPSARYVRITVTDTTNDDGWISISDIVVYDPPADSGTVGLYETNYDHIRSLVYGVFDFRDGAPRDVDSSRDADIDNYYGTVFVKRTNDGRQQEMIRYVPKSGGKTVWGWNYEVKRLSEDQVQVASVRLVDDAAAPPSDGQLQEGLSVRNGSRAGRIWCWYGKDMVMTADATIMAAAGLWDTDLMDVDTAIVRGVTKSVDFVSRGLYTGQPPRHDYCDENGYH